MSDSRNAHELNVIDIYRPRPTALGDIPSEHVTDVARAYQHVADARQFAPILRFGCGARGSNTRHTQRHPASLVSKGHSRLSPSESPRARDAVSFSEKDCACRDQGPRERDSVRRGATESRRWGTTTCSTTATTSTGLDRAASAACAPTLLKLAHSAAQASAAICLPPGREGSPACPW